MGKKRVNIGLFTSAYSYFLFLLINGYNENDIIIVHDSFPNEISKNINPIIVPVVTFKYGSIKQSISKLGIKQIITGFIKYFFNYLKLRIILFFKTFNKNVCVYGHAFSIYSFMFYVNENSNIIEDGLANYTENICETHKINPIIDTVLHIFGAYFINPCETYGSHKNIKKVYLTNEFDHPLIKDKVEVINIEKQWNNLSSKEQKEILTIFNVNLDKINFKGKTALILTQPLTEDNLATLEEELDIYKEFFEKFNDYTIIIKPHPRDLKDYHEIYPNIEIIDRFFPVELLSLIGITPDVVCSIFSTALLNFKESELYVYQGEFHNSKFESYREDLIKLINDRT